MLLREVCTCLFSWHTAHPLLCPHCGIKVWKIYLTGFQVWAQQHTLAPGMVNGILDCIRRSGTSSWREFISPSAVEVTSALLCPVMSSSSTRDTDLVEGVQWRALRWWNDWSISPVMKVEWAETVQPRKKWLRTELINVYKFLKGGWEDGVRLLSLGTMENTGGSGHKLEHQQCCKP